jgi:hypothetical protein
MKISHMLRRVAQRSAAWPGMRSSMISSGTLGSALRRRWLSTKAAAAGDQPKAAGEATLIRQIRRRGEGTLWTTLALGQGESSPGAAPPDGRSHPLAAAGIHVARGLSGVASAAAATATPTQQGVIRRAREAAATLFLPADYRTAVAPEYLRYAGWQALSAVTGTVTGTLALQALLQAVGASPAVAVGLAASANWLIKDGIGLLGGVLFAGAMGTRFDAAPRRYRLLAALLVQGACAAELCTPLAPHLFLPLAAASNVAKNVGWLAASATKAAMHRGMALRDNLGDVTAKAGTQATAAGLAGTALGIAASWLVGTDVWGLLALFLPLSAVHVWSAYAGSRAAVTRTLSIPRAEAVLAPLLLAPTATRARDPTKLLPSPQQVARRERLLLPETRPFACPLLMEPGLEGVLGALAAAESPRAAAEAIADIAQQLRERPHALLVLSADVAASCAPRGWLGQKRAPGQGRPVVALWFRADAATPDLLAAFHHACWLRAALESAPAGGEVPAHVLRHPAPPPPFAPVLEALRERGWDTSHVHFDGPGNRLDLAGVSAEPGKPAT